LKNLPHARAPLPSPVASVRPSSLWISRGITDQPVVSSNSSILVRKSLTVMRPWSAALTSDLFASASSSMVEEGTSSAW
jgi:hypothetical protein